jgi:ribonucleoside-diphosphate reductase alpha chain
MTDIIDKKDYLEQISDFIFTSKYARYQEDKQRRETWFETVDRLEQMHLRHYKNILSSDDIKEVKWAFDMVRQKKVVPSMRSLQFGGASIEKHNQRIYNCAVRHIDSLRSFAECFHLLLCGTGVGFGLTNHFLNRLPDLVGANDKTGIVITYTVEDTIEGWADSIQALLNCYFKNTPYTGRKIVFDYSKIRKKGTPVKTGGGKAPGYKGLKETHIKIKKLLDYIIEQNYQTRLKTVDAYDILMHVADAVLSGGIRRSACSVIFDKSDLDITNAKTYQPVTRVYAFTHIDTKNTNGFESKIYEGYVLYKGEKVNITIEEWELDKLQKEKLVNWWHVEPQRARSNNSVLLLRENTSSEEFKTIIERTKQFGEPGFVWADHPYTLFNPCFEISFIPVTDDGVCGVQFCNLTSINGRLIKTKQDFLDAVKAETIIGTLQAGYTKFDYLGHVSEELTREEALLGCSITGMMDSPDILLDANIQKEGVALVIDTNKVWANKLGINTAARTTCIKPEGTSSLFLGTASGIHPHHAKPKYFRRVQCSKIDNVYRFFKKHNKHMCEESVWSAGKTDDVITFPIEVDENVMAKDDLSAIQHLRIIKRTQMNWVIPGSVNSEKPLNHNVSCTVIVKDNEWNDVIEYIYKNRKFFTAVSLLPSSGDKIYPQAPMEKVLPEDEERWNNIVNNYKRVDYTQLIEKDDKTMLQQEIACAGGNCEIISL